MSFSPTVAGVIAENNVNNVSGLQFNDSHVNYNHNVYPQDAPSRSSPSSNDLPYPNEVTSRTRSRLGYPKFTLLKTTSVHLEKARVNLATIREMLVAYRDLFDKAQYRHFRDAYQLCYERHGKLSTAKKAKLTVPNLRQQALEVVQTSKGLIHEVTVASEARRNLQLFGTESRLEYEGYET